MPTLRPLLCALFPSTSKSSANNSHPLKNISGNNNLNNVFTPNSRFRQWSAIVETDGQPEHNNHSDNGSDKSILGQHRIGTESAEQGDSYKAGGTRRPQIRKTTEVNVSYNQN